MSPKGATSKKVYFDGKGDQNIYKIVDLSLNISFLIFPKKRLLGRDETA